MSTAILEEVFDSKIESFKTMFQLTNNQTSSNNYEIISRPVTTKDLLIKTVVEDLVKELDKNASSQENEKHPVMFFFDDLNDRSNLDLMDQITIIAQQRGVVLLTMQCYKDVVDNK